MRSTFKVLFYVNGSKEKNGIVPIMGRVTINGSVAQFSCKLTIVKTMWDAKGNRAKGKSKEARDINLALDNIKAQIIKWPNIQGFQSKADLLWVSRGLRRGRKT